jgi:aconitate hydratase
VTGALYAPPTTGVALRTFDPEPRPVPAPARGAVVASAETLAFAVATGEVGDPRAFKRPVRVTVPRALPTDDVLVARKAERAERAEGARKGEPARAVPRKEAVAAFPAWRAALTLDLVAAASIDAHLGSNGHSGVAVVCDTLDEVRDMAARAPEIAHAVRAVLAPFIPGGLVAILSAAGIAALRVDAAVTKKIEGQKTIALPAPAAWAERAATPVTVGSAKVPVTWLALGAERSWATGGSRGPVGSVAKAARS